MLQNITSILLYSKLDRFGFNFSKPDNKQEKHQYRTQLTNALTNLSFGCV
jgi:hypothetical protein